MGKKKSKDNKYIYLIITQYILKIRFDHRLYVTIDCERGKGRKNKVSLDDDDEDEKKQVLVKRRDPYRTKKCNSPFQLKEDKLVIEDNWKLYVKDGRHNHKIGVYPHAHAQAARLTDDQLKLTKEFSRCQVAPRDIMVSLLERNPDCVVRYNMLLLEAVGMTPMGKTFTVTTAFMWNKKAETYEWVLQ
ncbi:hypothetical protein M9H77_26898 [Catharanthus roseus]|uniref:Uncharacterized protein n=1 Tax=Catharanthus roseus TaxID=4058 RepID=A0ACC0AB68_CATRO|nr:hypothetical protein M9H77_26898 [Catharanthus roseus]